LRALYGESLTVGDLLREWAVASERWG
jgi:hypothetical protein